MEPKYTLVQTEEKLDREWRAIGEYDTQPCFYLIGTYDTLVEAQEYQKKFTYESLIIQTY